MSIRQKATQCLGKHIPDKTHRRLGSFSSRWPGHRAHVLEEQGESQLIQASNSRAYAASERILQSRETVKAWLESSPNSVIQNLDDESACSSSFESFSSSPAESVDHFSYSTQFQKSSPTAIKPPGHSRSRTISPPKRTANRNSADLSRIDYTGGSFLLLAFKNAQYRGTSSPPTFQYSSEDSRDDHIPNSSAEECASPRSEFSVISAWQDILAAANAAGLSTRDSSGNNSDLETPCEVLNVSDLDVYSAVGDPRAQPDVVRKPYRTRSVETPRARRLLHRSASGDSKNSLVENIKFIIPNDATNSEPSPVHMNTIHVNFRKKSHASDGEDINKKSNSLLRSRERGRS